VEYRVHLVDISLRQFKLRITEMFLRLRSNIFYEAARQIAIDKCTLCEHRLDIHTRYRGAMSITLCSSYLDTEGD
jgi:hypothetical protein